MNRFLKIEVFIAIAAFSILSVKAFRSKTSIVSHSVGLCLKPSNERQSSLRKHGAYVRGYHSRESYHKMTASIDDLITHVNLVHDTFHHISSHFDVNSFFLSDEAAASLPSDEVTNAVTNMAPGEQSLYSRVDKTGFIGFLADYVEKIIDLFHFLFSSVLGTKNSYGFSIILFTLVVKAVTFPLASTQILSTAKMQQLTPLQKKIQEKFASNEQMKNQLLAQLYQVANINPLAGCFPALVQIPIFISLYRALQNLVAENKLDEPFLWIPNLEGPSFMNPPSTAMDWIKTAVTGNPSYGWHDTICYLSIPFILLVSQTFAQKVLQPVRDPKEMTEQERFSQSLVGSLPLVVASFSLNVPAGLGVYWVVNNILTTAVTIFIKSTVKNEEFPAEVMQLMASIDTPDSGSKAPTSSSYNELRGMGSEGGRKREGFGGSKTVDTTIITPSPSSSISEEIDNPENQFNMATHTVTDTEDVESEDGSQSKKKKSLKKDKKKRARE